MASNKSRGTAKENKVVELLRKDGWVATRTPASLGTMDIIALKYGEIPRFIQVKGTAKPFSGFGPAERYDLLSDALKAGARAELAWIPFGSGVPTYIAPEDWPETFQPKPLDNEGE